MWLTFAILFAVLSPGVFFTIPSLGKKMGGKVMIAAMHAVLFVIVVNLLSVDYSEGFQISTTEAEAKLLSAKNELSRLQGLMATAREEQKSLQQLVSKANNAVSLANRDVDKAKRYEAVKASCATKTDHYYYFGACQPCSSKGMKSDPAREAARNEQCKPGTAAAASEAPVINKVLESVGLANATA